jgi:hypothetical protein
MIKAIAGVNLDQYAEDYLTEEGELATSETLGMV